MKFKVTRTDILNYLIEKYKYKTYLEIGVRNPQSGNFNNIKIKNKIGVDPNPIIKQDNIFVGTSDFFFIKNNKTFDLIFIDGLHLENQVDKDIANSLEFLNEGGMVLLHDCNPPTEMHQRDNYCLDGKYPAWNGTVWKSFAKLRMTRSDLLMYVIDTDWGVGVIKKGEQELFPLNDINIDELKYDLLEKNRNNLLNLISFDKFKKIL